MLFVRNFPISITFSKRIFEIKRISWLYFKVQAEIEKKWKRYILKRGGSGFRRPTRDTMTSFMSKTHDSVASASTYNIEKNAQNGKIKNNTNSPNDNSEEIDRNGYVSLAVCEQESQRKRDSLTTEQPENVLQHDDSQQLLILNSNANSTRNDVSESRW